MYVKYEIKYCEYGPWCGVQRHYDNNYNDFTYNGFTYNINKCNFTYMFFYFTLTSKVVYK